MLLVRAEVHQQTSGLEQQGVLPVRTGRTVLRSQQSATAPRCSPPASTSLMHKMSLLLKISSGVVTNLARPSLGWNGFTVITNHVVDVRAITPSPDVRHNSAARAVLIRESIIIEERLLELI